MGKTKEELLRELKESGEEFTKEELLSALKKEKKPRTGYFSKQKLVPTVSYILGALIVLTGLYFLVWGFWEVMGSFFRVGITLGLGVILFSFIAFLEGFSRGPVIMKEALAVLSAVLMFSGGFVLIEEVASLTVNPVSFLIISLMLAVMFTTLNVFRRSSIYIFFITAFTTATLYSVVSLDIISEKLASFMNEPGAVFAYLTSLIGLLYLVVTKKIISQMEKERKKLSSFLYFVGGLMIASPFFLLAEIYHTSFWSIIAFLSLTGIGLFALRMKSTPLLFAGIFSLFAGVFHFFSIIFVIIFSIFYFYGRRKDDNKFPYLVLIAGSLTAIPYAILSLGFISEIAVVMKDSNTIYLLLTSLIGLVYITMGWFFREKLDLFKSFSKLLYLFGSFAIVIPFFFLAGIYSGIWDVIAFLFIAGVISLGVYLSEKVLIFSGAVLLVINIITVSYRHFIDSIGWPIALIVIGLLMLGVGYFSYYLSKRIEE
jgi:hypothetical protein